MLEFTMRIDFLAGAWFQVKVVDLGAGNRLEIKTNPNTLVVDPAEASKIVFAVQMAVDAIHRNTVSAS